MNDYSVYLPDISLAYSAFLLGMASPGPNIMAVIGTSMSVGRASGIALALALASGSLTWAVLTVLGLAALLSVYAG
ncbi:MAG: amino acid exporter, partial [Paracoccaceae bacterium]